MSETIDDVLREMRAAYRPQHFYPKPQVVTLDELSGWIASLEAALKREQSAEKGDLPRLPKPNFLEAE